jgi:RNA-directed DNA polymerase
LKQGVIEGNDCQEAKEEGTPQGGVISPLLANIYLNPLDWLMAEAGFEMVRYADDMVVLCRSQEEAETALSTLKGWIEGAGLTLHPEKTRTVDMNQAGNHFDFLGYRFKRSRRGKLIRLVRPKSLHKLRDAIRLKTRRNNGKSMEATVAAVNLTLKGWYGYFKHVHYSELGDIDAWIRMRLRSILRKRRGGKGCGRGRDHQRWPNRYFTKLGLFCLMDAQEVEIASLRKGANH